MQTFCVRTFGCQMNEHDSEVIAGVLCQRGMREAADGESPDVVVFNTCCVRENADQRLYGQVASVKADKAAHPGMLVAVGGCVAQRDGSALVRRLPHVDVVFGTHNLHRLPDLLDAAAHSGGRQLEILECGDGFAADLPMVREHRWRAWVPIAVGCDNHCTYCIVPAVRGVERSRPFEDILTQVDSLVADGVVEITLLGQNVNSYGRDLYGAPRFAELLRAVGSSGVARVRFTTSHPKDLSTETIEAMAAAPAVCRQLHLPVQSGSDSVLRRMGRCYTAESYLAQVERLYAAMPDIALSTDIIVGFPGETDEDFEATMRVVEAARYAQAFTFIYSPREGTPAASMEPRIAREVVQPRFDRLVAEVQASALEFNQRLMDTVQRVLVEGASKRDAHMLTGRTASNRVVHVACPDGRTPSELAGTFIDVSVTDAQTWFLLGTIRG